MYVCVCQGVTKKQIEAAVADGADSLRALRLQLSVARQCGRCADAACNIIQQAQLRKNHTTTDL